MELHSPVIREGEMIAPQFTCDGQDVSPRLEWSGTPEGTRSYALLCEDPDAPRGTFIHWVLFNLPAHARALDEGIPNEKTLAEGAKQGTNDFGKIGYGGPCPPRGSKHRYFFRLYALDQMLNLKEGCSADELRQAMKGHILGEAHVMGQYQRRS